MALSSRCLHSMVLVKAVGAPGVEGAAGLEAVLFMGGGEEAWEASVKWMVRVAGREVSWLRLTVMGTAGLWYLRRGRQLRQNFLGRMKISFWG